METKPGINKIMNGNTMSTISKTNINQGWGAKISILITFVVFVLFDITFSSCNACKNKPENANRNGTTNNTGNGKGNDDNDEDIISIGKLSLVSQDITKMKVGAIVNAAKESLLGGGGIDGAIHAAAGSDLRDACAAFPEIFPDVRCKVGQAKITPGFNLPATNVIHVVGPVYDKYDNATAARLLADCYTNSLICAKENGARTVAFPCISTGIFGYPKDKAAPVALAAVRDFLASNEDAFDEIIFVCYGKASRDYKIYESLLKSQN